MCESKKIESADDFLRGQRDCKEGVILTAPQSEDYYRGFSARYQMDHAKREPYDVRWVWFESEAEIIRGENRALEEQGKVINGECECHV